MTDVSSAIPANPAPPSTFAVRRLSQSGDVRWIITMAASIAIPAALTLATVRHKPGGGDLNASSPYGYTVSLLLFLFPVMLLFRWRWLHPDAPHHKRALFWASAVIAMLGFLLDLLFGFIFFKYPNQGATLGIRLPAWSFPDMRWVPSYLPVEEFGFYIFGGLFVISLYMWADADWLRDYTVDDYAEFARSRGPLLQVHWPSLLWWGAVALLGVAYKWLSPEQGIPGYFLFIMVLGFLPTVLFLNTISPFVNWRAFGFAYVNLTLISLLWEATLGVPYGWWDYHQHRMLGIRIDAWSSLPIEAVMLWTVIAWDCVIAYELFRVFFHMDRPVREAMLGLPANGSGGTAPHRRRSVSNG